MKRAPEHLYFTWDSLFNLDDLKVIVATINKKHIRDYEETPAKIDGVSIKTSHTMGIMWRDIKDLFSGLYESIKITNRDNFGYHLYDLLDSDILLFNTYDSKDKSEYNWHKDGETEKSFDVKFTILINTSIEPYEGGGLQFFGTGGELNIPEMNKAGGVIMFKSETPHRVLPITSGIRRSTTLFIKGPKFV